MAIIYGGPGNDTLYGVDLEQDTIYGFEGNDEIFGNSNADFLYGGSGNDIIDGGSQNDFILGEAGNDALYGGSENDFLYGGTENDALYGGNGIDFLYGQEGNDTLDGGTESDFLYGGTENDALYGGIGNDRLYGQQGNDLLLGESGADFLDGGSGVDTVSYVLSSSGVSINLQTGNHFGTDALDDVIINVEVIEGSSFNDDLLGSANNMTLSGGDGEDTIEAGSGFNMLLGGNGADLLYGGVGTNILYGGDGADLIYARGASNIVYGDNGDDIINGGFSPDTIHGGAGNDFIIGNGGADIFVADSGEDTIADFSQGLNKMDLSIFGASTLQGAGDLSFSAISMSDVLSDKKLSIGTQTFILEGLAGITLTINDFLGVNSAPIAIDDVVSVDENGVVTIPALSNDSDVESTPFIIAFDPVGVSGGTIVEQSAGVFVYTPNPLFDSLNAGESVVDTFTYTVSDGIDTDVGVVSVNIIGANEPVVDTTPQTVIGSSGADTLTGADGNDNMAGGGGNDILYGKGGNDNMFGGQGNDMVYGGSGRDIIFGDAGNDTLYGGEGADIIIGDLLSSGHDKLIGGVGADTLTGALGNDIFVLDVNDFHNNVSDYIVDLDFLKVFGLNNDSIDVTGFGLHFSDLHKTYNSATLTTTISALDGGVEHEVVRILGNYTLSSSDFIGLLP